MAMRLGRPPSQLLLPLAFAAHAGSLLALTGTPVNVIVSEAAAEAGVGPFGFFEFALVGVPLVAGTIAIVVLLGERLLPDRTARTIPRDFSEHARTLVAPVRARRTPTDALFDARRSGVAEVVVPPRSGLIGETRLPGHGHRQRRPRRPGRAAHGRGLGPGETELAAGDTLLLQGTWRALDEQLDDPGVLVVDAPELVRRQAVPLGPGLQAGDRRARRDGAAARHRRRAGRGRRAARRRGDGPARA